MKNRIGIALTSVSILITCVLIPFGCTPSAGYIAIHPRSELMQPTFCMYRDQYFQERWDIRWIKVEKVQRSADKENQLESDSQWEDGQTVWDLADGQLASHVTCLTYGKVPPGYREIVEAVPLEPEQFYRVCTRGVHGVDSKDLYFIIRLDETGTPERFEYP